MPRTPHDPTTDGILTVKVAADLLNLAVSTVRKLLDSGELKGYRVPGSNERRISAPNLHIYMVKSKIPVPREFQQYLSAYRRVHRTITDLTSDLATTPMRADGRISDSYDPK